MPVIQSSGKESTYSGGTLRKSCSESMDSVIEIDILKDFVGLDAFPYLKKETEPASEKWYYIES